MPRFSGVQLARAAAIGELRRSSEFLVDGDWQSYQERIAREAEWPEQLPPPDDPRRRLMWGALTRQHKKMLAQLASTSAAITGDSAEHAFMDATVQTASTSCRLFCPMIAHHVHGAAATANKRKRALAIADVGADRLACDSYSCTHAWLLVHTYSSARCRHSTVRAVSVG